MLENGSSAEFVAKAGSFSRINILSKVRSFIWYRIIFVHKMLIRLEQSFIQSVEKLNDKFSEQDREELSQRTGMLLIKLLN